MINNSVKQSTEDALRHLSPSAFLSLGNQRIAYVRKVSIMGRDGYALHGADGTPLTVMESEYTALLAALENDLEPMRVH